LPAIIYERKPGAAASSPRSFYRPREPHTCVLYRIVLEHLDSLLDEARLVSTTGEGYPAFVEHEFDRYLGCGLLSHGFAHSFQCTALKKVSVTESLKNKGSKGISSHTACIVSAGFNEATAVARELRHLSSPMSRVYQEEDKPETCDP
jgi:hypothetical protein